MTDQASLQSYLSLPNLASHHNNSFHRLQARTALKKYNLVFGTFFPPKYMKYTKS